MSAAAAGGTVGEGGEGAAAAGFWDVSVSAAGFGVDLDAVAESTAGA